MNKKGYTMKEIIYKQTQPPRAQIITPHLLSDETMLERKEKTIVQMKQSGYDALIIYADVEHASNFEYLTGFIPRFEEALLVLHKNGEAYLLVGNEVMGIVPFSRIPATSILTQQFSLPDQPIQQYEELPINLQKANITNDQHIGIVGWKGLYKQGSHLYDVPHYIVEAVKQITPSITNATGLFIDAKNGVRIINNVDEIRHYEYGQVLAANSMLCAMNEIAVGKNEIEMASLLEQQGQRNNVVTVFASGQRFQKANIYPTLTPLRLGDKISMTVGFKGGLSSRSAYLVEETSQLESDVQDYMERLVIPYFYTIATWLETLHTNMLGSDVYSLIETILPKETYNWSLNPGHLCADEEWLSSPIYKGSSDLLQSGMLMQLDIIPSIKPYSGCTCENGVLLADANLRNQIQAQDPEMWERMLERRAYIKNELGIQIHEDILPLSNMVAYLRPYLLAKTKAMCVAQ